jgi:hypothetical protein
MIGVVVWSSGSREKAIIWCEDQATLAYLQGQGNLVDPRKWPQSGDLVELDTRMDGNLRHALNVSMLSEQSCPELPQALAEAASEPPLPRLRLVSAQKLPAAKPATPRQAASRTTFSWPRSGAAR